MELWNEVVTGKNDVILNHSNKKTFNINMFVHGQTHVIEYTFNQKNVCSTTTTKNKHESKKGEKMDNKRVAILRNELRVCVV